MRIVRCSQLVLLALLSSRSIHIVIWSSVYFGRNCSPAAASV